jgi:hypothetical protein
VIVDGNFSRELLAACWPHCSRRWTATTGKAWPGPALMAGTIGSDARALGGALLPLHANFAPDRDLFLKVAVVDR